MGKKANSKNNLRILFPVIAEEWDNEKNGCVTPLDVLPKSNKKYWFLCAKGHSYESSLNHRVSSHGNGCPYCSNQRAGADNNFEFKFPELAKGWHKTKNGAVTPREVLPRSHKKYWFQCEKGHEYDMTLDNKTTQKAGCPFCSNHRLCSDNSFEARYPEIAKEWHATKNGSVTPKDVLPGTLKKYWFECAKGHSYEAALNHRTTNKSGCPQCLFKTQEEVRRIFERIFQIEFKESRPKFLKRLSLDGYTNKLFLNGKRVKLGFEYDGEFHDIDHFSSKKSASLKNTKSRDAKKNELCLKNGVVLIRIHHSNKHDLEKTITEELKSRGLLPTTYFSFSLF